MHLVAIASAAALIATASASASAFNLNSTCIESEPKVRVHNRCSYDVYLWSVLTGPGCPSGGGAVVGPGDFYQENYRPAEGAIGTSIKVSKDQTCDPDKLLQLEYFIETTKPGYNYNYLDVSYVNCAKTKSCPTAAEGFYLKSGNVEGKFTANSLNNICPILSCGDWAECSKVAYVNWDDVQTKSCDPKADLDLYMCGGEAPGADDTPTVPASSQAPQVSSSAPTSTIAEEVPEPSATVAEPTSTDAEPTSTAAKPTSSAAEEYEVSAAEITPAPAAPSSDAPHVKTVVVYETAYEYVNAKRHAHGHRHFHA